MQALFLWRRGIAPYGLRLILSTGIARFWRFDGSPASSEYGTNILDWNNKELVVRLEVNGYRPFGVEEDFVVFLDGKVLVAFDLSANFDNPAGDCRYLCVVREDDSAASLLAAFVFSNQNPLP